MRAGTEDQRLSSIENISGFPGRESPELGDYGLQARHASSRVIESGHSKARGMDSMNVRTALLELLLAGFFAVACIKRWGPASSTQKLGFGDLWRFPDCVERLRRSRWQWFSMVLLVLVLRVQDELPLILEITVVLQFLLFIALPAMKTGGSVTRRDGNATTLGNH